MKSIKKLKFFIFLLQFRLSAKQRFYLGLRFVDKLTYQEIASFCKKKSRAGVSEVINRAYKKIKAQVKTTLRP